MLSNSPVPSSYTRNFLPSKKMLIVAGVLVLAGIAYWAVPRIVEYYRLHRAAFSLNGKPPAPLVASGTPAPTLDKDTDGDGVADWQEAIFDLDPNNPDTDGDGTKDFLPSVNGVTLGDALKISDTSKLALSVYGAFQNTPSDEIDPSKVEETAGQQVIDHAQAVENSFKKYTALDLTIGDSGKKEMVSYGREVLDLTNMAGDPVVFAKDVQDKILNGRDAKKEIDTLNSIISKLLAMEVPARASSLHLSLVNGSYYIVQALEIPQTDDELNTYTKSLIAQKNINLLEQTLNDINLLQSVYASEPQ